MAAHPICNKTLHEPDCSDVQITVRMKKCPGNLKSNISKVAHNSQMLKLRNEIFTFDHIKWENESQERVYKTVAYPFVDKALKGHSVTILAFGPIGTGKSYTMGTLPSMINNWQNVGLIQRCLKHIFEEEEIQVSASFVAIYHGEIHDLLNIEATLNRDAKFDPKIEEIKSLEDGLQLVNKALQIKQERLNSGSFFHSISSLQSHTLLTLRLKLKNGKKILESNINLIDLAGSKAVEKSGTGCDVSGGWSKIDKNLSALNIVITAMSRSPDSMLYSRDSILTSILEDILDTDCLVSLIACVSSHPDVDCKPTFRTLRVAESVKTIDIQKPNGVTTDLSTDQPSKPEKEKLAVVLSPSPPKIENLDEEYDKREKRPSIKDKIKNCMVILRKSDVDFYSNKEYPDYGKHTTSTSHDNDADALTQKIISPNIEIGCSAGTESTLSIEKLKTQNPGCENVTNTDSFTRQCDRYDFTYFDESFSISDLEDEIPIDSAKLHSSNNDISDKEYECPLFYFDDPSTLVEEVSQQSSNHDIAEKRQALLADNVSQLSISGQETVETDVPDEKQGTSKMVDTRRIDQLFKSHEVFTPTPQTNKMKRLQAILTTDFSEPGPSEIEYQTPKKIIKLDEYIPVLRVRRTRDLQPESESTCEGKDDSDDSEYEKKELNDKQKTHNNNILKILNTSTPEQLLDLPRIGFKTAVSIYQYRLIHGEFKSLKSLENMTFWSDKICQNFFAANNIFFE